MNTRIEYWTRGIGGRRETMMMSVRETDSHLEPTGIVEVSYELLSQMLAELGYFVESVQPSS